MVVFFGSFDFTSYFGIFVFVHHTYLYLVDGIDKGSASAPSAAAPLSVTAHPHDEVAV